MSSPPTTKLFVFGLGYSASRAARAFHSAGYSVSGTVRSLDAATRLMQLDPHLFRVEPSSSHPQSAFLFDGNKWSDTNSMSIHNALKGVTHILISVPTGHSEGEEDPVLFALGEPLVRATKDSIQWVGYLSTIGVYGETNGLEVDESAPVGSLVRRCQLRIKAERLWLDSGLPTHVFRIAGIYGPYRGTIARVRAGAATRIHISGRKFNRIHVDDIVNILLASATHPNPGRIYNVCDDEPAPADEVTAYACELLNERVPPRLSWEEAEKTMSAMAKSFYAESKICANRRIKDELGVKLIYPTYREGFLAQVVEEDRLTNGESGGDVLFPTVGDGSKRLVVLVNFGSLQAEAYLDLRQIGFQLSRLIRQPVVPCSFHFSDRIDSKKLHDLEAKTFDMILSDHLACRGQKASEIVILPLFFGKSCTLTEFLPTMIERVWAAAAPAPAVPLTIRVGTCLVDANDDRIAQILMERIQAVVDLNTVSGDVSVLVVDYDAHDQDVQKARELVAQQLRSHLKTNKHVKLVGSACVQRRGDSHCNFEVPLLAKALDQFVVEKGVVVCARMIMSSDYDAGKVDDIGTIFNAFKASNPSVDIRVTDPLKTHKLLSEMLQNRFDSALSKETCDYTLP